MGDMSYRITNEQQFYDEALIYVDNLIHPFVNGANERFSNIRKKKEIYKKFEIYQTKRNTKGISQYELLKAGVNLLLEDVDNWCNFSCDKSATKKEIILRLLISNILNCNFVSTLMISCNVNFNEEFIKDCIFVSSFLFKFDEWDDEHVNAVASCAASGLPANKSKELIELYGKKRLTSRPISTKFDFSVFNLDQMSEDFKNKFYIKDCRGNFVARY